MAIAFFLTCNYDVVITPLATCCSPTNPPKYEPITVGEYLFTRLSRQYSREGEVIDDIRERVARQGQRENASAAAPNDQSQTAKYE
jgi:isopenicillin N synthase-like dioxygenase